MEKKVFWIDNAIDENIIYKFVDSVNKDLFVDVGKSTYAQTQTDFQIKYYKGDFHTSDNYKEIREAVFKKIEELLGYEITRPKVSRNCFLKYNEPGMRSAMHVEHEDVHGPLGFLFYLTTEDSGYVKWVDKTAEEKYFEQYPNEKEKFMEDYSSYRQLYGNIEIQPKFNRLAIFETLGSHYVDTLIDSNNDLPRLCIMGWPYCKV